TRRRSDVVERGIPVRVSRIETTRWHGPAHFRAGIKTRRSSAQDGMLGGVGARHMSVTLMALCWRIEWPTVSMRLLALKLADCANDEGENIYPSVGRIERETGLGVSTIRRDLAAMEECSLLDVVEQVSGNKWLRSTTVRRFNTEKLRNLAEVEHKRGVYEPSRCILT